MSDEALIKFFAMLSGLVVLCALLAEGIALGDHQTQLLALLALINCLTCYIGQLFGVNKWTAAPIAVACALSWLSGAAAAYLVLKGL